MTLELAMSSVTAATEQGGSFPWGTTDRQLMLVVESASERHTRAYFGADNSLTGVPVGGPLAHFFRFEEIDDTALPYAASLGFDLTPQTTPAAIAARSLRVADSPAVDLAFSGYSDTLSASTVIVDPTQPAAAKTLLLSWATGELARGDTGDITVTVVTSGLANQASSTCTIGVAVDSPATDITVVRAKDGTTTLETARKRLPYQVRVRAEVGGSPVMLGAGEELSWIVTSHQTPSVTLEFDETVTPPPTPTLPSEENYIKTPSLTAVPDAWASPQTVEVTVVRRDANKLVIAGGNSVSLTLPVIASQDKLNVVLLLDRSGSMNSNDRWVSAVSGARYFCDLLIDENASPSAPGHDAAVLRFGGVAGYDTAQSGAPNFGGQEGNSYDTIVDFNSIGSAASWLTGTYDPALAAISPSSTTPIGSGMLYARDKLVQELGADTDRDSVLLVLSDGMQNRGVSIQDAIDNHWSDLGGNPNVRVFSVAVNTLSSWADVLRYAVGETGGSPAIDVKHIPTATTAAITSMRVQQWYAFIFGELFGAITLAADPDPLLASPDSEEHEVQVTPRLLRGPVHDLHLRRGPPLGSRHPAAGRERGRRLDHRRGRQRVLQRRPPLQDRPRPPAALLFGARPQVGRHLEGAGAARRRRHRRVLLVPRQRPRRRAAPVRRGRIGAATHRGGHHRPRRPGGRRRPAQRRRGHRRRPGPGPVDRRRRLRRGPPTPRRARPRRRRRRARPHRPAGRHRGERHGLRARPKPDAGLRRGSARRVRGQLRGPTPRAPGPSTPPCRPSRSSPLTRPSCARA